MNYNKSSHFLKFSWEFRKAYNNAFEEVRKEQNLTQNEIDVLLFLKNNAPLDTATDIVNYRAMSKSMISKSVNSLYEKRYLAYQSDKNDKRCIHLRLEEAVTPVIEKLNSIQSHFFSALVKGITQGEGETIKVVFNKIYENIVGSYREGQLNGN
jgi:DNA-binding MarR family transcriptional regulator